MEGLFDQDLVKKPALMNHKTGVSPVFPGTTGPPCTILAWQISGQLDAKWPEARLNRSPIA